jgi:gluconolactonase
VKVGADGMKLDNQGNLYLAELGIRIYDSQAAPLETIDLPHPPTNLCFAGPDRKTLFITARTAVYTLRMRVPGLPFREK